MSSSPPENEREARSESHRQYCCCIGNSVWCNSGRCQAALAKCSNRRVGKDSLPWSRRHHSQCIFGCWPWWSAWFNVCTGTSVCLTLPTVALTHTFSVKWSLTFTSDKNGSQSMKCRPFMVNCSTFFSFDLKLPVMTWALTVQPPSSSLEFGHVYSMIVIDNFMIFTFTITRDLEHYILWIWTM